MEMKTDIQIKQDVLDELKWDAEIDEAKIGVAVTNGAVTLSGHVPTFRQKIAAKAAAKRISGVLAIVDQTEVLLESQHRMTDEGLAERIANVLKWNVSSQHKGIKAEVKNGVITLTGEVEWQYQRNNLLKNVEHVGGVINVIDFITVKPRATASDVQKRIMDALRRHADIESKRVSVTLSNGTVTLSGTVESIEEMDRVEAAAWAAPGVSKVVDQLRVI
jgi:osmotically-inducible protein OsmY